MTLETISAETLSAPEPEDELYVFPVSFAQQRLWFLDQFEPNSPFYNIPVAVRLRGRLDLAVLQAALHEIVDRHEILRTTFGTDNGEPVQIIAPTGHIPLMLVDLRHLPAGERRREAMRLANEEAKRPFNLTAGPLLRVHLFQIATDDFVAIFNMHHIISDGWSIGVLIREISVLYDAFARKRPSPLPELPIQYADFAEWQRNWLQGDVLQGQLDYWVGKLGPNSPVLELPTDRLRPSVQTSRGSSCSRILPEKLTQQLRNLSRKSGTTLFMTLLAAFHTLLYRYTNQETINIGSPIANRNRGEIEGLIGFFVNTLVLRADLKDDLPFCDLLAQIKETTLEAYAHQDLPFESLVEALQPERDMSHSPLFQVMFILQNTPHQAQALPDLTLEMIEVETGASTFDITLSISEIGDGGLHTSVEFNTDLFNHSTIERMLIHFETLLQGIAAHPDEAIARLPLMPLEERHQLLVAWNDTHKPFPLDQCVHQLFERQVERTPGETAVSHQNDSLTYAQLNAKANQLAHHLRHLGLKPESRVAICLHKSLDMIITVLGTLKAGAAYIPLDPTHPLERLAFMIEDAQPEIIITDTAISHQLSAISKSDNQQKTNNQQPTAPHSQFTIHNSQFIILPSDWNKIAQSPSHNPSNKNTPNSLAYMIYTSGSTGKSKGVMIEHRNLVNAYFAWADAYELHTVRSHLQMANFAFDVFSGDLVRALLSGGKLVLCPRELLLAPDQLYALMREQSVDIAEFVPVVLRQLVQYLEDNNLDLNFMKLLACGSDNWYVGEYKKFLRFCGPNTRLINSFGLTEATIDSCYFESDLLNLSTEQVVPIGRPFANMQLYILDSQQQPTPIGIPGELYIGGAGVARGYHNRPELNAEQFIELPLRRNKNVHHLPITDYQLPFTAYRTGDRARWLANGSVEFLGRIDHQVKIRGYRIEPGEIEAILKQHPAVRQIAVMPVAAPSGDKRLVAYAATHPDDQPTTGTLRRFVQERLPDYMVPSAFMLLDEMPLLANGKVNRRALPAPDWSHRHLENEYVGPRTPTEKMLAEIWAFVLGVAQPGIHDNFFELGGHSLLATQLISRIRNAFDIDFPLRSIFESPTIAMLAEQVEIARRAEGGIQAPPIVPVSRDQKLPLSFAQQRLWFLDQLEPDSPFYNIPDAMRLAGELDVAVLTQSFNEVIRRHESLRTTIETVDGRPFQNILPALTLSIPVVDLTHLPPAEREAEAKKLAQLEAKRPFSLSSAPLLRAKLLRLAEKEHIILLTTHHIISDNWSSNILIQEVAILYEVFSNGRFSPLPELAIQYADFAHWQRSWLQGETLDNQIGYWKERLSGVPALLDLPTDRPRPSVQTFHGEYLPFTLSNKLTHDIATLCRHEGVTPFMLLLAAFQTLLYRYSGQERINIGSPIANRNRADIEGLIGFFVNTLVFTSDFTDAPTFREFLQQVRETALGAYAHQDLPFEMIVDAVQPERNLSHSPLFQVMFVTQNAQQTQQSQKLPDLTIQSVEAHSGTAKFDLTLFMLEGEQFSGAWEYNTDLFDRSSIKRMIGHFETLLNGIIANPDESVAHLPLLTEPERHQLLVEWNDTDTPIPDHLCVHQLFEEQAAQTPDGIAVRFLDQQITYADLNAKSNQLAHYLQAQGVGPESLVGVCMTRTPDLIVALLGALKAGGAYIPIDPTYPAERIRFMIEDAQPKVILTQEAINSKQLSVISNQSRRSQFIVLEAARNELSNYPTSNLPLSQTPDSLAYVIYTSGSTGRPKGAMLEHRGVVNYLTWCQRAYPVRKGNGSPVHSSISFDLTVTSLFAPLVSGQCVHLLPEEVGIELLADALRQNENYSLVKITPAHLELLSQQLSPDEVAGKTHSFIIGGENLLAEKLAFWQEHAPDTALINEYGPTETVVGCCTYQALPDEIGSGSVPIGQPNINTKLYIFDKQMQPVPIGVPGELYIGGVQVGRGYLNRPELTAEKFISYSVIRELLSEDKERTTDDGERMMVYRTGDLVKRLPDGNIEFLGRLDHQVKIHGYRIELGEIEAALSLHPAVDKATVIDREDQPGQKRLAAYMTVFGDAVPDVQTLRDFLMETLPDYMVPAAFVTLEAMPLTPNGKVDRKALPAPDAIRPELATAFIAPRDEKEQILVNIWSELLGIDGIGVHDSFFTLGGDSILSIQVVARANQAGLRLSVRHIFQHPTIAELAAVSGVGPIIQAKQGIVVGELPLTPIQHWFFEQNQPEANHWNQSVMLTVNVPLDVELLKTAVAHLISHHDALRLQFSPTDAGWQQWNADLPEAVPFTYVELSGEETAVLETHATQLQASLDLQNGPLLRVAYFTFGANKPGRLLILVHHLAMDGVSWGIVLEDLQLAYQQLSQNQPVQLPPKTTSFQDWARRLAVLAQSETLQEEAAWWTAVSPTILPRDFDAAANTEASAESITVGLTQAETEALLREAPEAYRTEINDILLTALAQALNEWTGQTTATIHLEGHGREDLFEDVDVSRTVGWFTSLYPVQLDLTDISQPGEAIKAVKEQLRQLPQRGIGYGLLRYLSTDTAVQSAMQAIPHPEASFNYLGQMGQGMTADSPLSMAQESRGMERSPQAQRTHLLEIDGSVSAGRLQMAWTFSRDIHRRSTIAQVAENFIEALRLLIAHCQSPEAGGVTLSDVADFGWEQDDLDDILSAIDGLEI